MENFDIYQDIATRTNGDIYIGVVGAVRTGKSTFISNFVKKLILPNIGEQNRKQRIIDELPQSGDGKMVMTTQPKFVPEGGVKIKLADGVEPNVRLIDCVGYPFDGADGFMLEGKERLVKTPWSDEEMGFLKAAEIGTSKVIKDHSTIGIMIATDGSITDIPREKYIDAERKVAEELKLLGKPYVIVLNTKHPLDSQTLRLQQSMQQQYGAPVIIENLAEMGQDAIIRILKEVLMQFPLKAVDVMMPSWLQALPRTSKVIGHIIEKISSVAGKMLKMNDYTMLDNFFDEDEYVSNSTNYNADFGKGIITVNLQPHNQIFYQVLSEQCGEDISDDFHLVSYIKELSVAKKQYEKIKYALQDVEEYGYGVVTPTAEDMTLQPPEIIKKGNHYGVRLKANAPSLHIMRVDVETEVNPVMSTESSDEDMLKDWLSGFGEDYQGLWQTNMFGKTLDELAKEGLNNKLMSMPEEARGKLRKTVCRIVNESKGGVLCILL